MIKIDPRSIVASISGMLLLGFAVPIAAQNLVSVQFLGQQTRNQLEAAFGLELRTGINYYKIRYETTGIYGQLDTASGLISVPMTPHGEGLSIVAYQHGTTSGPDDVPSTLQAGTTETFAYSGNGYMVAAADYLGLGDSKGFHPYVHRETEASAGYDCLLAAAQYARERLGVESFEHVFVAGYSQGGHAAMALQQHIEQMPDSQFELTASTPMSGPYDISGTMFDVIAGFEPYSFVSYPIYALIGYQEYYGTLYDSLEQVFRPAYIPAIEAFYNRAINLTELTAFVFAQLIADNGEAIVRFMFVDSTLTAMENDPDHPVRVVLRDNDSYNFQMQTPTRLLYCMADDQVPFTNSIVADSILQARGAIDLATMDMDPTLAHGACATPAILESARFFDSFITTTSIADIHGSDIELAVLPNPASDYLQIESAALEKVATRLTLIGADGRIADQWQLTEQKQRNISHLPAGIYILRVEAKGQQTARKIVIH